MTVVKFAFADPSSGGVDTPAGRSVRCALLEREASGGKYRSTRPFPVPLTNGEGAAVLSAGVWRVEVDGVPGISERYVQILGTEGTIDFTALPEVDPRSVVIDAETRPVWQDLAALVAQLAEGGAGGGVSATPHPTFAGVLVLTASEGGSAPDPVAPLVTLNPTTVYAAWGEVVTFLASASGTPAPTVQWQRSPYFGGPWTDIPGATATTYTTPQVDYSQSGSSYRAVFTNAAGSATSAAAMLNVSD